MKKKIKIKKINKNQFYEWFIGFFEGDGSFTMNFKTNRCFLIINQKDIQVLTYIRDNIKLGSLKQYEGIHRWVVSSKEDMFKVIQIINGNLILNKTNDRLKLWISLYNKYYNLNEKDDLYIKYKGKGEWRENSSWLAGFIDAEGCFNIKVVKYKEQIKNVLSLIKDIKKEDYDKLAKLKPKAWKSRTSTQELTGPISFRIRLRFIIKQKGEEEIFKKIQKIFTGSISQRGLIYTYTLDANSRQLKVIKYIEKHPLRSKKHRDFLKFKNTYYQLTRQEHLNIINVRRAIKYLARNK